jgi:hypothetical protein
MGEPSRKPLGNNQVQSVVAVMGEPGNMLDKVQRVQKMNTFDGLGVSLFVNMNIKIAQHNDFIIVLKENRQ